VTDAFLRQTEFSAMTALFLESFDFYGSVSDLSQQWLVNNFTSLLASAGTAFVAGQGVCAYATGTIGTAVFNTGTNESTVYGSVRLKAEAGLLVSGSYPTYQIALEFLDGANAQCSIVWQADGTLYVKSGSITGTNLGTYVAAFPANTWDSYQFHIVFSATAGSVEIRMDGSSTPIVSLTNVNTQAGSANSYANGFSFVAQAGSPFQLDDLFISSGSGAAPNGWLGDLRSVMQYPTGAVQTQFTPAPSGGPGNYALVGAATEDEGTTLVASSTAGAEDLYSMSPLGVTTSAIVGVNFFAVMEKTSTGARTAGVQVIANGSADTTVASGSPATSWGKIQGFLPVDPTGAAWTVSTVNGAHVGIKVIS
jgi:hypothetical protein